MHKYFALILFLFVTKSAFAQSFNCSVSKDAIALELVTMELLGSRLSDHFKCLDERKFKYIKNRYEPPEEGYRRFDFAVKLDTLKLLKLEVVDESTGLYMAHFEVMATEEFNSQKITEKIEIILHPTRKIQELEGCGDSLAGPSKYLLAQQCYKKPKT